MYFIYNGSEICPLPIITAIVNGESVELQNGRDYTLEYTNNVNASTDNKKAIITATGIGNFTGTLTQTFNINPMVYSIAHNTYANAINDRMTNRQIDAMRKGLTLYDPQNNTKYLEGDFDALMRG